MDFNYHSFKVYLRQILFDIYYKYYPIYKANKIRKKNDPIIVVFVLSDLSTWKTENLYLSMLQNKRFNPILAVTKNKRLIGNEKILIDSLKSRRYQFVVLTEDKTICEQTNADIINYQRPYHEEPIKHQYTSNKSALHFFLDYGIHSMLEKWAVNRDVEIYAWQDYFENDLCAKGFRSKSRLHGRNIVVTGTPIMDDFSKSQNLFLNPWQNMDSRKRIIWAPHHTIGDIHNKGIAYGTFLDIADDMLTIADVYKNKVYFAFKPHPMLYKNLLAVWGQERTDAYYDKWRSMENTQLESGEYMPLFKHSDAMIHDCCTFTVEYLAIGKPVMYIVRDERVNDNVDECSRRAFELHYHGNTIDDIKQFIDGVIAEEDLRKDERMDFVNKFLRPPHGKTACENIINAILGVEEYKNC